MVVVYFPQLMKGMSRLILKNSMLTLYSACLLLFLLILLGPDRSVPAYS